MDLEQVTSSEPRWSALTGTVLPGGYEVGGMLAADEHTARFRVRVLGDWSANAYLDAFRLEPAPAEQQIALWTAARELKHPNISSPIAAGLSDHEGHPLTYVVMNAPDETLAALLGERPVSTPEALELLGSLRRALSYLHANGWVHGHLCPEQVLAFGDSIRISSEYLIQINSVRHVELIAPKYLAPDSGGYNTTPAADMWCLGATLFEALTQRAYTQERFAEVANLPQPFNRVIAKCVEADPQSRCTLDGIEDLLLPAKPKPAPKITPAPEPVSASAAQPTRSTSLEKSSSPPVLTRVSARQSEQAEKPFPKLWLYVACAVIVVSLLLLWSARSRRHYTAVTGPAANAPVPARRVQPDSATAGHTQPAPNPPAAASAPVSRSVEPVRTDAVPHAPVPAAAADKAVPGSEHTVNGPVWRVVVYTYAHEADAANKATSLNQKHPQLNAQVFSPSGQGGPYLVTVGGKLNREEASRWRQRAVGLGLPHDSYIQNYKQ